MNVYKGFFVIGIATGIVVMTLFSLLFSWEIMRDYYILPAIALVAIGAFMILDGD